jgi:dipeptidyl aminopeptidase/acylaminoacyl peptidase
MDKVSIKNLRSNYPKFLKNILTVGYRLKTGYKVRNFSKSDDNYFISLSSSVKDVFTNNTKSVCEDFFVNIKTGIAKNISNASPEENSNIKSISKYEKDNNLEARVIKTEKESFLEIWYKNNLIDSIKIDDYKLKLIYTDSVFGKPKFSEDGQRLIFIAEKDSSKDYRNYFSIKDLNEEDKIEKNLNKFVERQSFGEALDEKSEPLMVIYNLEDKKLYKLDISGYPNIYPAYPQFDHTNRDVVFSGYDFPNFKLGVIYCLKRKSEIYLIKNPHLDEMNKEVKKDQKDEKKDKDEKECTISNTLIRLTGDNEYEYTNIFPFFSPSYKKLIYFSNEKAIPHMNGLTLRVINWEDKMKLDSNDSSDYGSLKSTEMLGKVEETNEHFNSIYGGEDDIAYSNFINEDIFVFSAIHKNTNKIYFFDIKNNLLFQLPENSTSSLLVDVRKSENCLIVSSSNVNTAPVVKLYSFNHIDYLKNLETYEKSYIENKISYIKHLPEGTFNSVIVTNSNKEYLNDENIFEKELNEYKRYITNVLDNTVVKQLEYNGVPGHLIYSNVSENEQRPVIYFIHGGPNSIITQQFLLNQLLFLAHGYAVLVPHYPGSTGYGQKYVKSLMGNIGVLEIKSQGEFLLSALSEHYSVLDKNNVNLNGGSHGGFSSCWLSVHEKYNKLFASALIRNPVTDLALMFNATEIPDWVSGQTLNKNTDKYEQLNKEDYGVFYERSPLFLSKNCTTPTLMMLGKSDKRVSYFNGYSYYYSIKENGCDAKLLTYAKDNHSLHTPETEIDILFNIFYWIEKHRR